MPLTHYALLNAQPREKIYKLLDGHGLYLRKLLRAAASGSASSTASADESNASLWARFPPSR